MRLIRPKSSQTTDPETRPGFESIYERYFERVYAYVASRMESRADAEDVVSETFLRVMKHANQLRGENIAPWIFRIAHNAMQDFFRSRQSVPLDEETTSASIPLEHGYIDTETQAEMLHHIRRLSPRRQEIITLKYYAGLRNREIAEVLGINEQSVASHLHRGLSDLHDRLAFTTLLKDDSQT